MADLDSVKEDQTPRRASASRSPVPVAARTFTTGLSSPPKLRPSEIRSTGDGTSLGGEDEEGEGMQSDEDKRVSFGSVSRRDTASPVKEGYDERHDIDRWNRRRQGMPQIEYDDDEDPDPQGTLEKQLKELQLEEQRKAEDNAKAMKDLREDLDFLQEIHDGMTRMKAQEEEINRLKEVERQAEKLQKENEQLRQQLAVVSEENARLKARSEENSS